MTFRDELRGFVEHRNAYLLTMSAVLGSISYGWDIGLIGGIISMSSFKEYFKIDQRSSGDQASFNGDIVSVLQGGCLFGALVTGYLSGKIGRKWSMLLSGIIYVVGSLIQSIVGLGSSPEVGLRVLFFGRFVGGIGVGMISAIVPTYVSECTPRTIRGRCTGAIQLANNLGIMLSFWVNYSASKNIPHGQYQWRVPFIAQMVPGVLFILAMCFQPETPRWLVEHGDFDRAGRALAYVSSKSVDDESVRVTLDEIKADFEGKDRLNMWQQLKGMAESRPIMLRSLIPSLVLFFQQWTGTNTINYFSPEIFEGLGITGETSGLFATGVYGVVKTVAVFIVIMTAVERFGRKKCLMVGGIGQGLCMLWIGGYSAIHTDTTDVDAASYVSIVAVYLYAVFYCIGWGPVPWVVAGEVAPNHLRPAVLSIAVMINWLFSLTISKVTPLMLENITYATFLIFGIFCFIMVFWTYFCLPETQGVALEDIKYLFERDVLVRALQDSPGGRIFLDGKRAPQLEEVRQAAEESSLEQNNSSKKDLAVATSQEARHDRHANAI
ncbi:general substrate transporter [Schizophyllum commune]